MRNYNVEIELANNDRVCRVETVQAENVKEACEKGSKLLKEGEMIYQITRDFVGPQLPQPVYDFFNGFLIAGAQIRQLD